MTRRFTYHRYANERLTNMIIVQLSLVGQVDDDRRIILLVCDDLLLLKLSRDNLPPTQLLNKNSVRFLVIDMNE